MLVPVFFIQEHGLSGPISTMLLCSSWNIVSTVIVTQHLIFRQKICNGYRPGNYFRKPYIKNIKNKKTPLNNTIYDTMLNILDKGKTI